MQLSSPEGVIYEGPSESYGSYSLTAKSSGVHTFKFINRDAAPKHIAFSLLGSLAAKTASGGRRARDCSAMDCQRVYTMRFHIVDALAVHFRCANALSGHEANARAHNF